MKKSEIEVPVRFAARYSDTLSDDEFGRWGIVAYAGKFLNGPFHNGRVASWEIAWIKKLNDIETGLFTGKFIVHPSFPYHGLFLVESIEQAKKEIEKEFTWFVKMSLVLPLVQPRNKTLHKANVSVQLPDSFRNFIRTHHLSAKWEQWLKDTEGN